MRNAPTLTDNAFHLEDRALRIIADEDGEPLFHLSDLCRLLEYSNARDAMRRHVRAKDVVKRDTPTAGGMQAVNYVREPSMYRLLMRSHAPGAERVQDWITAEVLPAIRRTGSYRHPGAGAEQQIATLRAELLRDHPRWALILRARGAGLTWRQIAGAANCHPRSLDRDVARMRACGLIGEGGLPA